jgi:hypothetical protein
MSPEATKNGNRDSRDRIIQVKRAVLTLAGSRFADVVVHW